MESPCSKVKEGKGGSGDWLGFESPQVHNERQYMNIDELLAKFPHGIVVLDQSDYVRHICLYPLEPTKEDCQGLVDELATDPDHGMVGEDLSVLSFCPATGDLLKEAMRVYSGEDG